MNQKLTKQQIESLNEELKDETKSIAKLSKKYNISRNQIYLYKRKIDNKKSVIDKIKNIFKR
jgi:Mor family transcriptional regulator